MRVSDYITVRIRYAVTGSKPAAEKALFDAYREGQGRVESISGDGYEARHPIVDVNPGECEGYTNFETFTIAIWLKNDHKLYDQCRTFALTAISDEDIASRARLKDDRSPELFMADWLQFFVELKLQVDLRESSASTDEERIFVSLARAALSDVNWREISEEWLDDSRKG